MNERQEGLGEFVVACSDAPPLLELSEEALDAPALLVSDAVVAVLIFAMAARRDNGLAALLVNKVVQFVGVVGAICQNLISGDAADQIAGGRHVILLARTEDEAERQAESIDYGVDFGAEATSGSSKSLGLSAPLFTRAPAA